MEVFNKIYSQVSSSVSSTVSQLSSALPGNPVTREYDANDHIASGGPGLLWKIYKGTKHSTKQEASIFVFEKKQLERYSKSDREIILESLKRGVTQLTKIRHPQVLTVQHPLEESRDSLAFATEPVFASLANVLGDTYNMPQQHKLSDYKLFDIEIKYGLLQTGQGLAFLHNDVKLLHKNICPESIIINQQGAWKIFGFDFCVHNTSPPNSPPFFPHEEYAVHMPPVSQPNMDYMAPECILTQTHTTSSDIFSLAMMIYTIHSTGNQVYSKVNSIQQFKSRAQQMKQIPGNKLQCIPEALREYVKLMLNNTPELRPDAHQFTKIPYFEDLGVKTLNYLDSLLQWDNLQKSQFYKGLPESLSKLPHRVKLQRVLPCLVRDLQQPPMVPFVLPSIMDIAQESSQQQYVKYILPFLKPVMKLTEPIQILLIFLQRMELLLKQTPAEDVQQHVLPMLYRGLDGNSPQIHELCLSVLPNFAGLIDHANVKNSLLPRIKKLCLGTSCLSVRVNCLLCLGKILEHLDKWLVLDEIIPFLPQIPSREPAVLMGILGIYKLVLNHKKLGITKEVLAGKVLPFLIPLCIENGLTMPQFNAMVTLVKQMFEMVESEHRTKLEQLNSVTQERKALEATMPPVPTASKPLELDTAFSGLGLDKYVSTASSMSLEEKQKLSKQKDTLQLFQNQSPLEPKPLPQPPSSTIKAKDLSNTLSSTSLSSPLTSPQLPVPNANNWNNSVATPNYNLNQNWGNWTTAPATTNVNPWTSNSFPKPQIQQNDNKNWSALDNLLPTNNFPHNGTKTPMNMMNMTTAAKPLLSNSNFNGNFNSNPSAQQQLSNDDIMDLLS